MVRDVIFAVFVIIGSVASQQTPECPVNSTYSNCAAVCPKTCVNYLSNQMTCNACKAGCKCSNGYILNEKKGHCILKRDCDPEKVKCPANKIYRQCGYSCGAKTCDNLYNRAKICRTRKCAAPGCFCKDGYVLNNNKDNICVPYKDCGPYNCAKDDPNMIFKKCQSSSCVKTCDNYNQPRGCTKDCKTGCYCKDGYVELHTRFNVRCVKPKQCPSSPRTGDGAPLNAEDPTSTVAPYVFPEEFKTNELQWLEKFLRSDGTITFLSDNYILAYNTTLPNPPTECTTGDNIEGKCTLLDSCKKLYTQIPDENSFKNYFCSIDNKYAGVCCTPD